MDTLPPELLRYFIPFLPLTSLIAARGVSQKWRTLTLTASLHPARKALLDIYLAAIVHPNFPSLVEALRPLARAFDRERYIANLVSRGCVLPDVFELWVLEWPSKAIHFWAWPGLERDDVTHQYYFWIDGNVLAESEPTIDVIPVPKKDVEMVGSRTCRGMALYEAYCVDSIAWCQLWLVVDSNERINDRQMGRLLWTIASCTGDHHDGGGCIFGTKKIFHDIPFGPPAGTDFKMVDFLNLLDVTCDQVDDITQKFYFKGLPPTEDNDESDGCM